LPATLCEEVIAMKGYFEQRGRAFKLVFDDASCDFIAQPVAHEFAPRIQQICSSEKPVELSEHRQAVRAKKKAVIRFDDPYPKKRARVA
jgi:hypothetical protein